ncbi:hypothetical protein H4R33_006288 [Dimargaris cristalligena]|uniref:Uncharacterized protein n=1 Tax=Dimargaris cristalligena TaxID=215637 RepID=A0A4P9ZK10_9FUNG|nr:hypothetical protein H4R33_006288 [Dimargaris cristalligena]RKP33567.1 hypothetical protein BJ085DRAFT_40011 [Dimargaris cristalligena]|eukprot:RKP33567.1 hypothetical protein BJ085DRAFT_40011 [Dimargaris cristalligena]
MQPMDAIMAHAWDIEGGHLTERSDYPDDMTYRKDSFDIETRPSNNRKVVEQEWEYLDYNQLSNRHKRVLFPLLYHLSDLPIQDIAQLYKVFDELVGTQPSVSELQQLTDGDPILQSFTQYFYPEGVAEIFQTSFAQLMTSVNAVLATSDQFDKLKETLKISVSPDFSPSTTDYPILLRLEFGNADIDLVNLISLIQINCGYASALGFETAARNCLNYPNHHHVTPWLLSTMTADGFAHPHRDSKGSPRLAIRVPRRSVEALLKAKGLSVDRLPWLDHEVLLDELYKMRYRRSLPLPRPIANQE